MAANWNAAALPVAVAVKVGRVLFRPVPKVRPPCSTRSLWNVLSRGQRCCNGHCAAPDDRATAVHVEIAARPRSSGSGGNMQMQPRSSADFCAWYALRSRLASKTAERGRFRNPVVQARQQRHAPPKKLQRRRRDVFAGACIGCATARPIHPGCEDVGRRSIWKWPGVYAGRLALQSDYRCDHRKRRCRRGACCRITIRDKPAAASMPVPGGGRIKLVAHQGRHASQTPIYHVTLERR